jgi:hypothetical protein
MSNGENRGSLSPFVLELLRKQSHARTFWMRHFSAPKTGLLSALEVNILYRSITLDLHLNEREGHAKCGCTDYYGVQMHKEQTNKLSFPGQKTGTRKSYTKSYYKILKRSYRDIRLFYNLILISYRKARYLSRLL